MKNHFWSNKRVLITGHTGFKGSWLSLWLQSLGATLCGVALAPPTKPSLFDVARICENMEHTILDIRNYDLLKSKVHHFKPEIIIHMAAQPLVRYSYQHPVETYETNIMGTINLFEAARLCKSLKVIINVTTDKCYENREWIWGYREDEPMGGRDPYSSSKACSELISSAYKKSFFEDLGIAIATVRAGNVIGGGDWASDRLIPDCLRALENREPIQIRNPNATRPWQHVLEPISGYLELAERLYTYPHEFAEGWNFGPIDQDARPVKWIVERLCKIWGEGASWTLQSGSHPHESNYLKLDISKACSRLNWHPRWSIDMALTNIIDWHKGWLSGCDMHLETLKQIYKYNRQES